MKLSETFLIVPFIVQGLFMVFDEFYFHEKRGLGRWESLGHPLDTLTVISAFLFLLSASPNEKSLYLYVGIAVFSCVFITKDEWIHRKECLPSENWLHAILFILHPVIFLCAGLLWWQGESRVLQIQALVIFVFMIYQLLRWNVKWRKQV